MPSTDLSALGINLHSGGDFDVTIEYQQSELTVTIRDMQTKTSVKLPAYPVDIPSQVGGSYAYVGFTGGTGGFSAVQVIKTWSFSPPEGNTLGNVVVGNRIGTDVSGTRALGNNIGVLITGGAVNNTVGGSSEDFSNVISGNLSTGVDIEGIGTSGNTVAHNHIGTDISEAYTLPNSTGVLIGGAASGNTIGGQNIISGNNESGIHIRGAGLASSDRPAPETSGNTIVANWIGINEGYEKLSNDVGVLIDNGAYGNIVGGDNQIGFNPTAGIEISGIGSDNPTSNNVITGNSIGTDRTAVHFIGNGIGVLIVGYATNNTVGGDVSGTTSSPRTWVRGRHPGKSIFALYREERRLGQLHRDGWDRDACDVSRRSTACTTRLAS